MDTHTESNMLRDLIEGIVIIGGMGGLLVACLGFI